MVICNMDGENKVSKIFIVSLRLIWCAGKEPGLSQAKGSTATKIAASKSEKPICLLGFLKKLFARFKQFYKIM